MKRLTVQEVAYRLGASVDQVKRLIRSGALPAIDISAGDLSKRRHYRIDEEELEKFERRRSTNATKVEKPTKRRFPDVPNYLN